MDKTRLLLYLSIGTAAMMIPIMLQGSWYQIAVRKRMLLAFLLTTAGTLGTMLLFYIENGKFGGTSFYGAIFFVPVLFILVARFLKLPYNALVDLCAPAECAMLVIMKIQCWLTGCCGGVLLYFSGKEFVFPSQQVELATALVLCVVLLLLSRREKFRGRIYPWYMVLYGINRFVLNIFRRTGIVPFLHMPFGNFWSLVSIAAGAVWLTAIWAGNKNKSAGNNHD